MARKKVDWDEAEKAFEGMGVSTPLGYERQSVDNYQSVVSYERKSKNKKCTLQVKYDVVSTWGDKIVLEDGTVLEQII